jgi:hypothetical protein
MLARLSIGKRVWAAQDRGKRTILLRRAVDGVVEIASEWVRLACEHRGIDPDSPLAGEEWISGPMTTARNLHLLAEALEQAGRPTPPRLRKAIDGRTVADVFPRNLLDRFLFYNMSAEVWIQPDKPASQGRLYRDEGALRRSTRRLALVLGAGNVSSIGPLDAAHKLFVEGEVVLLKMNPVNAYLGPLFERAFDDLIADGFLAIAYGGAEVGDYLCRHEAVDSLHLTGSHQTYEAIVWGADPEERRRRIRERRPRVDKPFSAELGCVTPILVVPGRWSEVQLDFQARHVASMVAHNASFNCTAGKLLVTSRAWPQREAFLGRVKGALAAIPSRRAYYPGAQERHRAFLGHYPRAEPLVPAREDVVPWTWIPDVRPERGEYALQHEAFCGVLAETSLDGGGAEEFLQRAAAFANAEVWGSLSCVVLVDPATATLENDALERAIADLRYGSIGVNAWTGVNFGLGVTSWGAFPGNRPEAIGSGSGTVHNTFLFDHPEKSVVRAPFRIWPKPVWFADHANLARLGRWMTRFEAHRTPWHLARVGLAGLRG